MTLRTATMTTLSLFTFARADEGQLVTDDAQTRADMPADMDGINNSTEADSPADDMADITPDDVPRLVQSLMQDIYDSEDDCIPGATILGTFSADMVTGKALDTTWRTAATFDGNLGDDGFWDANWTGVSDEEYDPNDPAEVETGEMSGVVDADDEAFSGTIHMSETVAMDLEGYWVYETDVSGFFFGVAWDCE